MHRTLLPLAAAALLACAGPSAQQRRGAEIHHDLGVEALRGGRAQEALREFDEAIKLAPSFAEAHRGRGLVLDLGFGRLDEAEKEYRRALALRPAYPEAHNDLGQLLAKTSRREQAVAEFDAALSDLMYREPWVARCNRGLAVWGMGRKEEGISDLKACVAQSPRYCEGRRNLGQVLLSDGRTREAVDQLSAYAEACPRRAEAHLQLALARMKAGDAAGARTELERCRELGLGTPEGDECGRTLSTLR